MGDGSNSLKKFLLFSQRSCADVFSLKVFCESFSRVLVGTWPSVNKCVGMGVPMCVLESVSVCLSVKKSV